MATQQRTASPTQAKIWEYLEENPTIMNLEVRLGDDDFNSFMGPGDGGRLPPDNFYECVVSTPNGGKAHLIRDKTVRSGSPAFKT